MDWDDRLRFNASRPARAGLQRMAAAIAANSKRPPAIMAVRRLRGGVDASTHAIHLDPGGWVVLKRARITDTGPAELDQEFNRLDIVDPIDVPTPEPIALDAGGDWFGMPAFVMSRLPGRPRIQRHDDGPWISQLAEALAVVHGHGLPQPSAENEVLNARHAGLAWQPAGRSAHEGRARASTRHPRRAARRDAAAPRLPPRQRVVASRQAQRTRRLG